MIEVVCYNHRTKTSVSKALFYEKDDAQAFAVLFSLMYSDNVRVYFHDNAPTNFTEYCNGMVVSRGDMECQPPN